MALKLPDNDVVVVCRQRDVRACVLPSAGRQRKSHPGDKSEVDRFVNADLRHSRESNENELANYPEPPARGA